MTASPEPLAAAAPEALRIEQLDVVYGTGQRQRRVLNGLNLAIGRGESYGLVGESGCGKTTAALAAMRYLARNGRVSAGRILIAGADLMALSAAELRRLRTHSVSMVYQDAARALNPALRIGRQMAEVFDLAEGLRGDAAQARVADMLERVQIASPRRVMANYPHELSGGMQQRVVIAMALSAKPALLILDEPTTGLDATVAAEVLDLIAALRAELATAILFISHSLSVIARMCDRVGVLYAGELVEEGPTTTVFAHPRHPYTVGLLRCVASYGRRKQDGRLETIPGFVPLPGSVSGRCVFTDRCGNATERCHQNVPPPVQVGAPPQTHLTRCFYPERASDVPHAEQLAAASAPETSTGAPLLRALEVSKTYRFAGRPLRAVREVTLELWPGETLGLVGESGSGKTSLARALLGLFTLDAGVVELAGERLRSLVGHRTQAQRKALQMVFQNPGSSLNRSQSVRALIGRSLRLLDFPRTGRELRLRQLAAAVRLPERYLRDKPGQLSGGLQQRVSIARAFAGEPRIVVCDEPTSSLDVSVQSAILNLLLDLQASQRVSYLFISHDLRIVSYLADRIAVLYRGRLVEIGPAAAVLAAPHHPYTEALLSADPGAGNAPRERIRLRAETPGAPGRPRGCVFQGRCPRRIGPICEEREPPLLDAGAGHAMRCHIPPAELESLQRGRG
ncbi:MAG TPA: ABC transporter ATP-binding protein [Steroidobacteraceae bacterium]